MALSFIIALKVLQLAILKDNINQKLFFHICIALVYKVKIKLNTCIVNNLHSFGFHAIIVS